MGNILKYAIKYRNIVLNSQCGKSINDLGYAGLFAHFNLDFFP